MIKLHFNFSKAIREIDNAGKAILKDTGDAIAIHIWNEFETLVKETPQWTGTTAASWRISTQYRVGPFQGGIGEGTLLPERTASEALAKGHMHAVSLALNNPDNWGALQNLTEDYKNKEIFITNNAPGATRSEDGPLRSVNKPEKAFERFQARLRTSSIKSIRSRKI